MRIKKILCVLAAMFAITSGVYGAEIIDLSAGASVSIGNPFLRGSGVGVFDLSSVNDTNSSLYFGVSLDLVINFTENFGLETGFGFSRSYEKANYSTTSISNPDYDSFGTDTSGSLADKYLNFDNFTINGNQEFNRTQLYVPIMFRAQYGYGVGDFYMVTYGSIGAKIGFGLADFYVLKEEASMNNGSELPKNDIYNIGGGTYIYEYEGLYDIVPCAGFTIDIAIAIGQEFKLGENHYVGVRFGLDINVLEPHSGYATDGREGYFGKYSLGEWGDSAGDIFMDNFNFSLTYRYSFASMLWG